MLLLALLATLTQAADAGTAALHDGEGFVVSGGVKIWYRVEGAAQPGLPILIIHGGPGETARPFERTIGPLLALSRPVIYTDYRGAGRSERPKALTGYSFEQFADDDEAIRKQLGIASWAVFGHSNGAATAVQFALRHREATKAVVLCTPLLSPRDLEVNLAKKLLGASPVEAEKLRAIAKSGKGLPERFEAANNAMRSSPNRMFYEPSNFLLFKAMQDQLNDELGGKGLMAGELWDGLVSHGFFAFDAFKLAGKLTMPVLVLDGAADSELSLDNGQVFAATVPAGKFVAMEHSGHFPYIEETAATTMVLENFLDSLVHHD